MSEEERKVKVPLAVSWMNESPAEFLDFLAEAISKSSQGVQVAGLEVNVWECLSEARVTVKVKW